MQMTSTVFRWLVRLTATINLLLGLAFWSGNAQNLIPVHILVGLILVLSLWALSTLGAAARVGSGLVATGFIWSLLLPVLGLSQDNLMPGASHWAIRLLHLLVGIGAFVIGETLTRRIQGIPERAA